MTTFADLISTKTLDDWKAAIVNIAGRLGLKPTSWAEGGYTRTKLALFAQLYTWAGDNVRIIAASAFLDTAEGAWLKLLAKQVFNVDPIEATFAKAPLGLTLQNQGGGLYAFYPGDIVVAHEHSGKTYRNTSGGTLSPGLGQTIKVDLIAEEAGSDSSADVGTITVLVTTVLGVSCTNEVALIGLDEESADSVKERCRQAMTAQAIGGIKSAYSFYAKSATRADGGPIGITRVQVMPPPGDGTLQVFVASVNGSITGDDVTAVQSIFDLKVTPYGLNATATSASNLAVTVPCTVWIPASLGMSATDARNAVHAALRDYVNALPVGGVKIPPSAGRIYWRALLGVVENAIKGTLKAQLTSEADINVADGQAPIWTGQSTDITVEQV